MRALLLLLLASGTASAGNNEIAFGGTSRALRTTSADAVTNNSLDGGTLSYARALEIDTVPGVQLWAEGAFDWGGAEGKMFQVMDTELRSSSFSVAGRARYALHPRLAANARFALGPTKESLDITDGSGQRASDAGWGAMVAGSVGLELRPIIAPKVSFALRFDPGYVATSPIGLVAHAETSSSGSGSGALMLPMQDASLGQLKLSSPRLAINAVAQF